MSIEGVKISKRNGGLGRKAPTKDMVSGMVLGGIAPVGAALAYALGTVIKLQSIDDAKLYGFDAAYDVTNTVLVYHHINEFFIENPDGTLYLMVVAQGVTLTQMCDKAQNYVQKLLTDDLVNGEIRMVAVALNPAAGYSATRTLADGLDADVLTAVLKAQELADNAFTNHYPVDVIVIEGREFNGTATAAKDLRTMNSPNVAVMIGADPAVSASNARFNTYAAVGTLLGVLSRRKVDECVGQVDDGNLTDEVNGRFLAAGLSSNLKTATYTLVDQKTLDTKGYIFCMKYSGYDGVYFNEGHTCVAITSDYAEIENNRTINKAVRAIYLALMPKVKKKILLDNEGKIRPQVRKSLESDCKNALSPMEEAEEISGKDAYIDPDQKILVTGKLSVKFSIIPTAIGREIEASVGFENPNK